MDDKYNLVVEDVPVSKIHPAPYNPRVDLKPGDPQYEKIKASIHGLGYIDPLIWNKRTGNLVGGHQRFKILTEDESLKSIKCVVIDVPEDQEKIANLSLNKNVGDWDKNKLALMLTDLNASDLSMDIEISGFSAEEISDLEVRELGETHDDDFDIEEQLKKPVFTKSGDLWKLGKHRLLCGDSTNPANYEILMGDAKANLVVTDPPYNVAYEGKAGKIQNDNWSDSEAFYNFLKDCFTCLENKMADDASIYVFHADTEGLNFRKAFVDAGFYLSGCCIWKKPSLVLGRSPYQWQHEPCLYGWKKEGKHLWYSDRKQTTIWEFEKPKRNDVHPTMKPIPLIAYCIQNSSMSQTVVLDPFLGSGTTIMACEQIQRIGYGLELDPHYCDVIVNRYIEMVGSSENVTVVRDGVELPYAEASKIAK